MTAGVGFGVAAGDVPPLDFQAEMTTTVTTAIAPSATSTTFVSIRRLRLLRPRRRAARARLVLVVAADEARVVLVDVELAVEPEVLGVGAQESLDVGLRRQQLELLLLEGAQVLPADLRGELGLGEVDAPAQARLTEAVADLEHGALRVARRVQPRLLRPAKRAVDRRARAPP